MCSITKSVALLILFQVFQVFIFVIKTTQKKLVRSWNLKNILPRHESNSTKANGGISYYSKYIEKQQYKYY